MSEHALIDEMDAKLTGASIVFQNIENSILENNLYGVDINEESVEIAQLSLWLRTAKPHRKLNTLNRNIKCGNSLVSDPAVAGEKAFDWQKEFPQVFEKGGFDVVIGNPPYVFARKKVSEEDKDYYTRKYESAKYQVNTFSLTCKNLSSDFRKYKPIKREQSSKKSTLGGTPLVPPPSYPLRVWFIDLRSLHGADTEQTRSRHGADRLTALYFSYLCYS